MNPENSSNSEAAEWVNRETRAKEINKEQDIFTNGKI